MRKLNGRASTKGGRVVPALTNTPVPSFTRYAYGFLKVPSGLEKAITTCASVTVTTVLGRKFCAANAELPLTSTVTTTGVALLSKSACPVTVTVCGVFQSAGVNTSGVVSTRSGALLGCTGVTVTLEPGSTFKLTVNTPVASRGASPTLSVLGLMLARAASRSACSSVMVTRMLAGLMAISMLALKVTSSVSSPSLMLSCSRSNPKHGTCPGVERLTLYEVAVATAPEPRKL